jgi:hypothetical protein
VLQLIAALADQLINCRHFALKKLCARLARRGKRSAEYNK